MDELKHSAVESRRFGMNIYRGVLQALDTRNLINKILDHNIDIAILRIPSEKKSEISKLDKIPFPYLQADTLVYYYVDFRKYSPLPLKNTNLEFFKLDEHHYAVIDDLVEKIFTGYTNHYFSNPGINKKGIVDGYKEWVRGYCTGDDKIGWLVQQGGENIGFATCNTGSNSGIGEGVLYGILQTASGSGIYTDIIRFTQSYLQNNGCHQMKVSTQVQNFAVQKVWSREGFFLKESFDTIHINSMLGFTLIPAKTFDYSITKDNIEKFGQTSGDLNPVHFDDEYANIKGFDGRIAHGLIPVAWISRYIGTEFPGHGTLFLSYSYHFLKPLYPDRKYKIVISFPYYEESRNRYLSLVRILDENDDICLLSYHHLLKR